MIFVSPYFVYYMNTYRRHPWSNQSSNIKCRALRKKRIASRACDTSPNGVQLFVTQGILETKISSLYSSAINAFLIQQLLQLPTWILGIHSPLRPGAPQPPSSLFGLFLTLSNAPSCSTARRAPSQSLLILLTHVRASYLTLFMAEGF